MKHILFLAIGLLAATAFLSSCKTTEANYRAAYDRAIANRDSTIALESTIYGADRRPMGVQTLVSGTDTVEMRVLRVAVTEDGGGLRENLKPFNVVVGQFKQLFNAKSLRERLVDAGYPTTFVVHTAEPYYYVVLSSHARREEAIDAIGNIPTDFPISLRSPLPFILATTLK